MTLIAGIIPGQPVAGEDLAAETFEILNGQVVLKTSAVPDFFRSGTMAIPTVADGVNDTADTIVRPGKMGLGTSDPSLVQATLDNFGTFTTRGTTVANSAGFYLMSGLVPNTQAAIMITQTVTDCALSVGTPIGQTAFGRYFRVHNDPASTHNLTFQGNVIKPGRFIDLQWNGTAWASETLYQPDGFPRTGSQSVGGVITAGATSYNDSDGNENATITLPTAVGRRNEIFTVNHLATADATLLGTNKAPATNVSLTPRNRVTRYISDGVVWRAIVDPQAAFYHGSGYTVPGSPVTRFNDGVGTATALGYQLPTTVQNYLVVDGNYTSKILLPATNNATGRISVYVNNSTGSDTTIGRVNTDLTSDYVIPSGQGNSMHFEWSGGFWRWCPSPEPKQSFGGNVTAMVSNAPPTTVLQVGGLFEITMPASTDVRIRAKVPRQVYITSEGLYNGGSFTTTTNAIVNLTTTAVPADNNVHVAGEADFIFIHDVLTGRIFRVTVWRLAAIAGNWSGWVEEIGVSAALPIVDYTTNAAAIADTTLPTGAQYTVIVGGFKQVFVK